MKILRYIPFVLVTVLVSCGGTDEEEVVYDEQQPKDKRVVDYDEFTQECEELETEILSTTVPDEEKMREAVTMFQDFAGYFPDDPKAPSYLFKASDYAHQLKQPEKSVKILNNIINTYPDYDQMLDVYYSKASQMDWELRDTTGAKEAYQLIIDNYPEDNRAKDAALRIKYIAYGFDEYSEMVVNGLIEPEAL